MATMISEVYDAFVSAGTPDDKARKAAEAIANYEKDIAGIRTDLAVVKWMVGLVLVTVVPLFIRAFLPGQH